ncbi:MAG: DUF2863 family protein [Oxalobacter sp.]|jgi:hypothetical protein|nr:MAG: DUF2863 family protein [Oxalobacter sp.]
MRRPSKFFPNKLSADSQRLISLAQETAKATSRLERRAWEQTMDGLVQKLLKGKRQDAIDAALDSLFKTELNAYDVLLQTVEAASESCTIEHEGLVYDALLIAAPVLAWTRFLIPAGPIPAEMQTTLAAHLSAHVLAKDTHVALAPALYAIDQLPFTHSDTCAITKSLAMAAIKGNAFKIPNNPPDTAPFLADTRYLIAAVAAPAGQALFRWQTAQTPASAASLRTEALAQWQQQAGANIARLLTGCNIEFLLPESYFAACRKADLQIRPCSIRAAVHYLTHTLNVEVAGLCAIVAGFGDASADAPLSEYRIGFSTRDNPNILYGIVWPLYGQEEDDDDFPSHSPFDLARGKVPIQEILELLQEMGVVCEKRHHERFPMEFCDDCGAPLFADATGNLVHAEMPEDAEQNAARLH